MKRNVTLILALALVTTAPLAWGHGPFEPTGVGPEQRIGHILAKLDLSSEQQDKIDEICVKYDENQGISKADVKTANDELRVILENNPGDETAIRAAHARLAAAREDLLIAHARRLAEIRTVLTADQLTRFNKLSDAENGCRREDYKRGKQIEQPEGTE